MLFRSFLLVPALIVTLAGCATLNDNDPTEFHDAQASIDSMNDHNVDETLPQTSIRVENNFEEAVKVLRQSEDQSLTETTPTNTKKEMAIAQAVAVKNSANDASRLHAQIKEWDSSAESFNAALDMIDRPDENYVDVEERLSPFAKLRNTEISSTLAFFDTDKAQNPVQNLEEIESLVAVLKKDPNFQVVLTGHADVRGKSEYNMNLAMQRALMVAELIKANGIDDSQIIIESAGEEGARFYETTNQSKLQIDRRVVGTLLLR